ncbi:hypothetical protein FLL45_02545 [Aliikangiella marina]|uniref:Uncharacterized protein n=1 Tax=Aliikangiella marina TaxID=1712262 RepID=A0A545THZ9_9GAMM|nr:hypothetical protein [Aliikangiella marina]TQV76854.1 hypothetical protein FLL45_02545 [Aliikangiella marina]
MNKCPNCNNTPISFFEWNRGLNAFSCKCQNCSWPLRGKIINIVLFAVTVLSAVVGLIVAREIFEFRNAIKGVLFIIFIAPLIIIGSGIGYWMGGYKI